MAKEAKMKMPGTKGTRGSGPITISYLDAAGAEAKRVGATTEAIRIADKSGNAVDFKLGDLSPSARNQLAILGIVKRVDTFVRNGSKIDGANVIELANSVIGSLKSDVIYSRKEGGSTGGSAGRPFDFDFWRVVTEATAKAKGKPATEAQLDSWVTKLKAKTPADRKAYLIKLKADPTFKLAFMQAEAAKLKGQIKSGTKTSTDDALADLF